MELILYTDCLDNYLKEDNIINYKSEIIIQLADKLSQETNNDIDYIKKTYEYVRDNISHSADINADILTCSASEVLTEKHGICFAKSHLLAALLRYKSIPTGFCYQKIPLNNEIYSILVYHGLNGVYINDYNKWICLDARGNKEGINTQFSLEESQLAYPICTERGEENKFVIYPDPDNKIIENLRNNKTRTELWKNLPTELGYLS